MQRRALVVGVSQYSEGSLGSYASFSNNANAIADILEPTFKVKRLPEVVDGDRVRVGKGGVTSDLLQDELCQLFTATDLDTVLFYFSGHGLRGQQCHPKTYLATTESEKLDDGYRKSIEIDTIKQFLKDCPAREQIVWLDCCYSGGLADFADECDRKDGKMRFIITASRMQDPAYQEIAGEMGVFTRVLVESLARTGDAERRITCAAIEDTVREKLQKLQYPQMPQFYRTPNKIIEFWQRENIAVSEFEVIDSRLETLKRQRENLLSTISIEKNFEDIELQIKTIEVDIKKLQKERLLVDFSKLWENKLSEIDFQDAKTLIRLIKENYLSGFDRRYSILLLDNAIAMGGELLLRWLENYLITSCKDWLEPFVCDFEGNPPSQDTFISKLSGVYEPDAGGNIEKILVKLKSKLRVGDYFLIKIIIQRNDGLSEFLLWFVQVFWQQFTQMLNGDCAVVAAIFIDDEFNDISSSEIFCEAELNEQKIKRLPVQNWTQKDVLVWLRDHSGLGIRGCSLTKFSDVAALSVKQFPFLTRNGLLNNLEILLTETIQMEERT